jgi:hypothetical protein
VFTSCDYHRQPAGRRPQVEDEQRDALKRRILAEHPHLVEELTT